MAEEERLFGGEEEVTGDGFGRGGPFAPVGDELGGAAYRIGDPADEIGSATAGVVTLAGEQRGEGDGVQGRGVAGRAFEPGRGEAVPARGGPVADGDEQCGAGCGEGDAEEGSDGPVGAADAVFADPAPQQVLHRRGLGGEGRVGVVQQVRQHRGFGPCRTGGADAGPERAVLLPWHGGPARCRTHRCSGLRDEGSLGRGCPGHADSGGVAGAEGLPRGGLRLVVVAAAMARGAAEAAGGAGRQLRLGLGRHGSAPVVTAGGGGSEAPDVIAVVEAPGGIGVRALWGRRELRGARHLRLLHRRAVRPTIVRACVARGTKPPGSARAAIPRGRPRVARASRAGVQRLRRRVGLVGAASGTRRDGAVGPGGRPGGG